MATASEISTRIRQLEKENLALDTENRILRTRVDEANTERIAYHERRLELRMEHARLRAVVDRLEAALRDAESRSGAVPSMEYLRAVEQRVGDVVLHASELVGWMSLLSRTAHVKNARDHADSAYVRGYVNGIMEDPRASLYHRKAAEKEARRAAQACTDGSCPDNK